MEYAIKRVEHWDNYNSDYVTFASKSGVVGSHSGWVHAEEKKSIKRWKTEDGVKKAFEDILKKLVYAQTHIYAAKSPKTEQQLRDELTIVRIKELPPPKVQKAKLTRQETDEKKLAIAKSLISHGWKPNKEYSKGFAKLDENGFAQGIWAGEAFLIDSDGRYAVTLKSSVMTVHDGTRAFCKVISMAYNEVELAKHELICGRIALKLNN